MRWWQTCGGLLVVPIAMFLAGCSSTSPSTDSVSDFVAAVTASDGSVGVQQRGAAPSPSGGPTVTVSSSGTVSSGGTDLVRVRSSAPFQKVDVSIDGADGFFELPLTAPTTDITLTARLGSSIPQNSYVAQYRAASPAGLVGTPAAVTNTVQPSGAHGAVTATIDGVAFSGQAFPVSPVTSGGVFGVVASNASGSQLLQFGVITSGPGTFNFANPGLTGANAFVLIGNAEWSTAASTGFTSGTLVINTLTASGASGTFFFTGDPVAGTGATGTKNVTNGIFNVTF